MNRSSLCKIKEMSRALAMILLFYVVGCASQLDLVSKGIKHYNEGQYDNAISVLTEAIERGKGTMLSTAYKMRGVVYVEKGQYALALNDMTKSISLQSKKHDAAEYLPSTYYARGVIYNKLGNRELAVADFRMAADLEPKNIDYAEARYKMDEAEFQREARRYREMQVKPTLTEEARKYTVQAETAIKQKSFKDAVDRYEDALKIAPWWPEGHFNMALILAELSRYTEAAWEMKRYLLLVPNAPDVRAAQDKIYEWEGLARKSEGGAKK